MPYYVAIRSGEQFTDATIHHDEDCARDNDRDLTPRPLREDAIDEAEAEMCPECTPLGNESGGDGGDSGSDEPASVSVLIKDGRCPWCDDYEGDHVGQHASSAHPESWAEYKREN